MQKSSSKVIIASQPKTGNTWAKHLLAHVLDLPMADLPLDPTAIPWASLGPRWIGHQHYLPSTELLAAGGREDAVFLTTLRHPADALISLFHHVQRLGQASDDPISANHMLLDGHTMGEHTIRFIEAGFNQHLYLPTAWLKSNRSYVLRYEDLWQDPEAALRPIIAVMNPSAIERIPAAVDACNLNALRKKYDTEQSFFRKGGIENWRVEMPLDVQRALSTSAVLAEYFEALGYSMPLINEKSPPDGAPR